MTVSGNGTHDTHKFTRIEVAIYSSSTLLAGDGGQPHRDIVWHLQGHNRPYLLEAQDWTGGLTAES